MGQLPEFNLKWLLYGAGFDNLGKNGLYEREILREINPDEVLLKVDAVSLCFSDTKVVRMGNEHPRMIGRNLQTDPVVLSHELSVQVVEAGEQRKSSFPIGSKYIVQPDIYYNGMPKTMGYVIDGALQQFIIAGREILDGDEGCNLLPMKEGVGYSEAALCEPWSCVEASYCIPYRRNLKGNGTALFIGNEDMNGETYTLGGLITENHSPKLIIASKISGELLYELKEISQRTGVDFIEENHVKKWSHINEKYTNSKGFDDIIMLGTPEARDLEETSEMLAKSGIFAIVAQKPMRQKTNIDVGALHYDGILFTGTTGNSIMAAYSDPPSIELPPGGSVWMAGAGGPLGQMHTQRSCEKNDGPSKILVTDIDDNRLNNSKEKFGNLAGDKGIELEYVNPRNASAEEWEQTVEKMTGNGQFDYIVLLASVIELARESFGRLKPGGVVNFFAGIPKGNKIPVDVSNCYMHRQRWIGSSGTSIAFMNKILKKIEDKTLNANRAVAAIGGMNAAREGLMDVAQSAKPGKIIIYPQINFPLTGISDLKDLMPAVAAKLEDGVTWTNEAEEELLSTIGSNGTEYAK